MKTNLFAGSLALSLCSCAAFEASGLYQRVIPAHLDAANITAGRVEAIASSGRGEVERADDNRFFVRCKDFEAVAAKQETDVWCWAACAEMVHRWNGREIAQETIAQRILSSSEEEEQAREELIRAASFDEIIGALSPESYELSEATFSIAGELLGKNAAGDDSVEVDFDASSFLEAALDRSTSNTDTLVEELAAGRPSVVGLRDPATLSGHVYVVYGAEFSHREATTTNSFGDLLQTVGRGLLKAERGEELEEEDVLSRNATDYAIWRLHAIDPYTGKQDAIEGARLEHIDFLMSGEEARSILERQQKSWTFEDPDAGGEGA